MRHAVLVFGIAWLLLVAAAIMGNAAGLGMAHAHDIPDGTTPRERCENVCEKKHCDCVRDTPGPQCCDRCHSDRDRCKRACAVSAVGPRP